jgi:cytochrome c-type biogenesis protein CcmH/NrfG
VTGPLYDEIALREASIADAQREYADGELSSDQYTALVAREAAAITKCREAIAAQAVSPRATTTRHRRPLLVIALGCFALVVVIVLVAALTPRQPGSSDTGGISEATQQRVAALLAAAEIDQAASDDATALAAYTSVLSLEPDNVEALTQSGWLTFSAGSIDRDLSAVRLGEHRVETAVDLEPTNPDSRLYYAIIVASTPGNTTLARRQFEIFVSLKPSAGLLAVAAPWLKSLKVPPSTQ